MTQSNEDKFYEQRNEQLGILPGHILLTIATNESAGMRWRKAAVEIMLEHKCAEVNKPEIASILAEVKKDRYAKEEVTDVVETAIESPLEEHGAQKASVTTQSLSEG